MTWRPEESAAGLSVSEFAIEASEREPESGPERVLEPESEERALRWGQRLE